MLNWLKRSNMLDRDMSFTLFDGELYFNNGYHDQALVNRYGISRPLANLCRYLFPRGRVIQDNYNAQTIIEASSQLESKKNEIASRLNIPFNAKWNFSVMHYEVISPESLSQKIQDLLDGELSYGEVSRNDLEFLKEFVPKIYHWVLPQI